MECQSKVFLFNTTLQNAKRDPKIVAVVDRWSLFRDIFLLSVL